MRTHQLNHLSHRYPYLVSNSREEFTDSAVRMVVYARAEGHQKSWHIATRDGPIDVHHDHWDLHAPQEGKAFRYEHSCISEKSAET